MWLLTSFLARTFASPNLSHEPKARVATKGQFVQFLHLVLCLHEILILPLDQKNKEKRNQNYLVFKGLLGTQIANKKVHFLCCNPIYYKVARIYMLLTWHKNTFFSNLWLVLDFQLEKENIFF